jgi:hypothetical protein
MQYALISYDLQLRHGAKIIPQFIRPCILVSVHKHFLVSLTHFLKNLAA